MVNYLFVAGIVTMNDCVMPSCCLDFSFYFLLNLALPVFADFYLQVVCSATICYLHVGNAFSCAGLAPHLQSAIINWI